MANNRIFYTYYSFETDKGMDGLGYIGSRACPKTKTPESDNYYGSPKVCKTILNNPFKAKIILGVFNTREEALEHESYLHKLWNVADNPHFANASNQTSSKFYCPVPWNKGIKLPYPVWNKGKKGLQTHDDSWKLEASKRNSGSKNYFYEGKKFIWHNNKTNEEFIGSVLELFELKDYFKNKKALYSITWFKNNKQSNHKGWYVKACVINDNQQPDGLCS